MPSSNNVIEMLGEAITEAFSEQKTEKDVTPQKKNDLKKILTDGFSEVTNAVKEEGKKTRRLLILIVVSLYLTSGGQIVSQQSPPAPPPVQSQK